MYRRAGSSYDLADPIWYSSDYRKAECEKTDSLELSEEDWSDMEEQEEASDDAESNKDGEEAVQNDKYLIFTTGFKTYSPHQIGFKRIKPFTFPKRIDPGPSLKERLVLHERKKEMMLSSSPPPNPNWLDYEAVADKFDKVDHLIDLHGHIVGMGLSPDHR